MVLNERCTADLYGGGSWEWGGRMLQFGNWRALAALQSSEPGLVDGDNLGEVFVVDLVVRQT